jgi:hypothetical protein
MMAILHICIAAMRLSGLVDYFGTPTARGKLTWGIKVSVTKQAYAGSHVVHDAIETG